jgi:hypothetical protein
MEDVCSDFVSSRSLYLRVNQYLRAKMYQKACHATGRLFLDLFVVVQRGWTRSIARMCCALPLIGYAQTGIKPSHRYK